MRVFKNKAFAKFAKKEGIRDSALCAAVRSASAGLIDADYGAGVIKQRLAREGKGKAGGFRTIVLFRKADRAFFVYGFAKNERGNISEREAGEFKMLAKNTLNMSEAEIEKVKANKTYIEVMCHD